MPDVVILNDFLIGINEYFVICSGQKAIQAKILNYQSLEIRRVVAPLLLI
ncbi:hypothetical protein LBMAG20_19070 [Methylocystaceae bacterium]|nr:hypothetical protein LBMAG20_19070 [Methylocystaceae bacterium]